MGENGTISMYNWTNSHAEIYTEGNYNNKSCVDAPWFCTLRTGDQTVCSSYGETCIVSLFNSTNSHVGQCGYYNKQVCCKVEDQPPRWSNAGQNTSNPSRGDAVKIYAYWTDNGKVSYAILSTNETGAWENKTQNYSSPMLINSNASWSNFTWQNSSVPAGTVVGWRIYANDTAGNWNYTTPESTFTVMCKIITVCQSGSCDSTTIQGGINLAQSCDTVLIIDSNWYNENVALNKSIALSSNSTTRPTINSTGTTLNITKNGATVSNLTIAYNGTAANQHVVWITGNYTTVANCTIRMSNYNSNYPVYIQNSANNTIYGNNITSQSWSSRAVYISGSASTNNTIDTNLISYAATSSYAISIEADNNTVRNNNITSTGGYLPIYMSSYYSTVVIDNNFVNNKPIIYNKTLYNLTITATTYGELIVASSINITINNSAFTEAGILFINTTNSTISNSNITTKASAIWLVSSSNYNTIYNNNISTSGSDRSYAITLSSGNYINITKNNITTTGGSYNYDIEIASTSDYDVIDSNIINQKANYHAIAIYSGSDNHKITKTNISNTNTGAYAGGIRIEGSGTNITYSNITTIASSTATYDSGSCTNIPSTVCIRWGDNNRISDCILNSTSYYDIFASGTGNQINYLINTSFNKTDIMFNMSSNTKLYNQYYLDVLVSNTTGDPIDSATVVGNDTDSVSNRENPTSNFTATTNSSGYIYRQTLSEFLGNSSFNSTQGYLYFTNYTLNTSKAGYINDTRQINLTFSRLEIVNLTIYSISLSLSPKLSEGVFFTNRTGAEANVQYDSEINVWNNATWNYNSTSANKTTEFWINNTGTVPEDFCLKGLNDLTCVGGLCGSGTTISIDNVGWNNDTINNITYPSYDTNKRMSLSYQKVAYSIAPNNNIYLRFWLFVPIGKSSGKYNTTYRVEAVSAGGSC
jgi:hypothetical protein